MPVDPGPAAENTDDIPYLRDDDFVTGAKFGRWLLAAAVVYGCLAVVGVGLGWCIEMLIGWWP